VDFGCSDEWSKRLRNRLQNTEIQVKCAPQETPASPTTPGTDYEPAIRRIADSHSAIDWFAYSRFVLQNGSKNPKPDIGFPERSKIAWHLYQTVTPTDFGAIFGVPAYYKGALYYGPVGKPLVKLAFSNGKLVATPAAVSINSFPYPGTIPSIANGVVFAIEHASGSTVLHAYDATNLHELYSSNENSTMEAGTKFAVPTIFNKMVYVGTDHHVSGFGLK